MIDIIIPYILGPDNGLELKYALRSIEKNFKDEYKICIIGDLPDWCINVFHIAQNSIEDNNDFVRFRDTQSKILTACKTKEISKDFIYSYDDIFFISDCTIKDFKTPYAVSDKKKQPFAQWFEGCNAGNNWIKLLRKTLLLLHEEKKNIFDCETHTPRLYNKDNCLKLFRQYGLSDSPYMFATLYFNNFANNIKILSKLNNFKAGIYNPTKKAGIIRLCKHAKVLNVGKKAYDKELISALEELFPHPSKYEVVNLPTLTTEKSSIRKDYPFLNSESCPHELKILVADKITAYYNYVDAHTKLFACTNKQECYQTADKLINNFIENRTIYEELNHYKKSGKVLGIHPIFEEKRRIDKIKTLSILELYKYYNKLIHRIWRIDDEIKKNTKPQLLFMRNARKMAYNRELIECKKLLNINE